MTREDVFSPAVLGGNPQNLYQPGLRGISKGLVFVGMDKMWHHDTRDASFKRDATSATSFNWWAFWWYYFGGFQAGVLGVPFGVQTQGLFGSKTEICHSQPPMAHLWLAATSESMYFSSLGESTMLHHRFPYVFLIFLPLAMEFLEECTKLHGYRNRRCINISEFTLNLRVAIWNFLLPSQKWLTCTSSDGTILLKLMTGVVKSVLFLHPWAKDVQQLFHICEPRIWCQPSTARVPTMRRSWRSIAKLLG